MGNKSDYELCDLFHCFYIFLTSSFQENIFKYIKCVIMQQLLSFWSLAKKNME